METRNLRKERIGVVSSNKGDKTITVMVKWKEKHPIYGKFVNKTKKYHAHDEKNECSIGDTVRLMETRPLSKTKRWRLVERSPVHSCTRRYRSSLRYCGRHHRSIGKERHPLKRRKKRYCVQSRRCPHQEGNPPCRRQLHTFRRQCLCVIEQRRRAPWHTYLRSRGS